ncbi:uncharacterized protein A1O9_00549 [Exophiala aquamarina CBS 119918]|uniref:Programmed cell death protein 2 C-terminal domain-containing protein n=1 Tax=Exophiala aquamarina CBS 119918 TaxID=1182545 RepID=A0A072PRS0_9EURO|nr:uncharacterized protein A1O9_00549 [Exophiala aquamarina CBS 119918]KEF62576.1 hypothetical protein A1O9_00549 [Exophiala aquamarina CBS 119918]
MPDYDSDSSDNAEDYSTTDVTLGYAATESTGDDISHLGGHSTWLDTQNPPPAALAKCKVCNGYMSLLLQLNADLLQFFPHDERRLHLLCCRKKTCSKKFGSIRAFREVKKREVRDRKEKKPKEPQKEKPQQDLGTALFGGTSPLPTSNAANPFSLAGAGTQPGPANPFASVGSPSTLAAKPPQRPIDEPQPPVESFTSKLKIGMESQPEGTKDSTIERWPESSAFPPPFTSYYLDAYPEELEKEDTTNANAEASNVQYDTEDGGGGTLEKDTFESSLDKTFQKFSDRVAQNPEQVLRYEFKGEPLLYSGTDNVASRFVVPHGKSGAVRGMPRCEKCGSQRAFELQLVPGLIYQLEKDEAMDLEEGMEWGTIILGTCVNNCGEAGKVSFREEWVGVQWEERVARK